MILGDWGSSSLTMESKYVSGDVKEMKYSLGSERDAGKGTDDSDFLCPLLVSVGVASCTSCSLKSISNTSNLGLLVIGFSKVVILTQPTIKQSVP